MPLDAFEIGTDNVCIPSLTRPTFFLCRNPLTLIRNIRRYISDNAMRTEIEFVPILKRRRVLKTRSVGSGSGADGGGGASVVGIIMGGSSSGGGSSTSRGPSTPGSEGSEDEEEEVVEGIKINTKMFCFGMPLVRKSYGFGPRDDDM